MFKIIPLPALYLPREILLARLFFLFAMVQVVDVVVVYVEDELDGEDYTDIGNEELFVDVQLGARFVDVDVDSARLLVI